MKSQQAKALGAQLRAARTAAGLSLAQMAARTSFDRKHLGNCETGSRQATAAVVLAYERALGEDQVRRRGLLSGVAAMVVPAAVGALLQRGFTSALADDRMSVDAWRAQADGYGHDYMRLGAGVMQNRLAGDLVVIQRQLDTPAMWATAARMLTVYGKTTQGAREASGWYRTAAEASDRSDDTEVRVWVRGRSALALAYEGAGLRTARQLATEALAISDKPTIGQHSAAMALAHVSAIEGDVEGTDRYLDAARRIFDLAGSYEQVSDYAVPEWRYYTTVSMLLSRLGDPRAVAAQDAADGTRPATLPRFATHIELHRGLFLARTGDGEAGLVYARAALDKLPAERRSLSLSLMMDEIEQAAAIRS